MPKEAVCPITIAHSAKIYEGKRVVTIKGKTATQYVTSDIFMNSKTDPMTYKYPSEETKMEHIGKLIFAELLQECGVDLK